ncbi:MAG: ABC transporter permease [Planctomycetota bacterium]
MRIHHIVLKELRHRWTTSLVILGAIVLCVGIIVLLFRIQQSSMAELERALDRMGNNVVILHEDVTLSDYFTGNLGEKVFPQTHAAVAVRTDPPVLERAQTFYQRKVTFTDPDNPDDPGGWVELVLCGVGPQLGEAGLVEPRLAEGQADLGSTAAERLEDHLAGNMLLIPYQGPARGAVVQEPTGLPPHLRRGPGERRRAGSPAQVRVRKIRERTGTIKDYMVFLDLNVARRLYGLVEPDTGKMKMVVNVVEGVAKVDPQSDVRYSDVPADGLAAAAPRAGERDAITEAVQAIQARAEGVGEPGINVYSMRGQARARGHAIASRSQRMHLVAVGVFVFGALLVGGYTVLNVRQRRKEMGILLAIAARPKHLTRMFLEKMLILALLGGLIGSVLGSAAAVQWGPPETAFLAPWSTYGLAILIALVVTLVPSLAGVFVGSHIDPVDTLRDL